MVFTRGRLVRVRHILGVLHSGDGVGGQGAPVAFPIDLKTFLVDLPYHLPCRYIGHPYDLPNRSAFAIDRIVPTTFPAPYRARCIDSADRIEPATPPASVALHVEQLATRWFEQRSNKISSPRLKLHSDSSCDAAQRRLLPHARAPNALMERLARLGGAAALPEHNVASTAAARACQLPFLHKTKKQKMHWRLRRGALPTSDVTLPMR